jgi:hypothetical protein
MPVRPRCSSGSGCRSTTATDRASRSTPRPMSPARHTWERAANVEDGVAAVPRLNPKRTSVQRWGAIHSRVWFVLVSERDRHGDDDRLAALEPAQLAAFSALRRAPTPGDPRGSQRANGSSAPERRPQPEPSPPRLCSGTGKDLHRSRPRIALLRIHRRGHRRDGHRPHNDRARCGRPIRTLRFPGESPHQLRRCASRRRARSPNHRPIQPRTTSLTDSR